MGRRLVIRKTRFDLVARHRAVARIIVRVPGLDAATLAVLAGGAGARPAQDGISGVQTHMTNSLNTPIEALEYAYPFRVSRYAYRTGSGGAGQFRGGDGLVRELELLTDAQVTLLADRRKLQPYGLQGGEPGEPGHASISTAGATTLSELPGKCSRHTPKGSILRIETPGGGGWGKGF